MPICQYCNGHGLQFFLLVGDASAAVPYAPSPLLSMDSPWMCLVQELCLECPCTILDFAMVGAVVGATDSVRCSARAGWCMFGFLLPIYRVALRGARTGVVSINSAAIMT